MWQPAADSKGHLVSFFKFEAYQTAAAAANQTQQVQILKKCTKRPLLSAPGCHTRLDGHHCPLRTYLKERRNPLRTYVTRCLYWCTMYMKMLNYPPLYPSPCTEGLTSLPPCVKVPTLQAYLSLIQSMGWKSFTILYENNEGLLRLEVSLGLLSYSRKRQWERKDSRFLPFTWALAQSSLLCPLKVISVK